MPPAAEAEILRLVESHLNRVDTALERMSDELRDFREGFQATWERAMDKLLAGQERAMNRITLLVVFAMVAVLASSGANLWVSYQGVQVGTGGAAVPHAAAQSSSSPESPSP